MIEFISGKIETIKDIRRRKGSVAVFIEAYKLYIRPFLPKSRTGRFNGVDIGFETVPILDKILGVGYDANYEANYIHRIHDHVTEGSNVAIVGGGWGVSTVHVANKVGPSGQIAVFEASRSEVDKTRTTCKMNGVEDRVIINHAIVGTVYSLRGTGDKESAAVTPITGFEQYDTLLVDCDGCEIEILEGLCELDGHKPDKLIVEHHGVQNSIKYDRDRIETLLRGGGYDIIEASTERYPSANRDSPKETIFVATQNSA